MYPSSQGCTGQLRSLPTVKVKSGHYDFKEKKRDVCEEKRKMEHIED
jgi:hypothetical protein